MDNDNEGMIGEPRLQHAVPQRPAKKPMPVIGADPKLQILQDFPKIVAFYGHPGPSTPPIQEIANLFVLPDMFTRVARGSRSKTR